jgi:hypothetical protein
LNLKLSVYPIVDPCNIISSNPSVYSNARYGQNHINAFASTYSSIVIMSNRRYRFVVGTKCRELRILICSIERAAMYTSSFTGSASAIFINYLHKEMLVRMLSKTHIFYTSVNNAVNKLVEFTKRYPVPAFAISGLFVGSFFHWPLYQPILVQWIWFMTLIVGGTPIILDTIRGILTKKFASDIVAMMAIIAAILLNDALPGGAGRLCF